MRIEPEVFKSKDQEMLQELVLAAVNEADAPRGRRAVQASEGHYRRHARACRAENSRTVLSRRPELATSGGAVSFPICLLPFTSYFVPADALHANAVSVECLSMPDFAPSVTRLIDELKRLPGIGQKTAQRLAFYLLRVDREQAFALSDAIREAKEKIRECSVCNNITDTDPCLFCTSATRNRATICVVEEATNIQAVEKTRQFNGLYHVLGGALSPLQGIGPDQLQNQEPDRTPQGRHGRRDHHRDQSHGRRRSHRRVSVETDQAAGSARHAHRHGHPRRLGPRIRGRSHHVESHGRPPRSLANSSPRGRFNQTPPLSHFVFNESILSRAAIMLNSRSPTRRVRI